jgi:hypothetical protein
MMTVGMVVLVIMFDQVVPMEMQVVTTHHRLTPTIAAASTVINGGRPAATRPTIRFTLPAIAPFDAVMCTGARSLRLAVTLLSIAQHKQAARSCGSPFNQSPLSCS